MNTDITTYEDLRRVLDVINKETAWCKHITSIRIAKYLWVCECGRNSFAKATPELRALYEEWLKAEPNDDYEEIECFGIKILKKNLKLEND